MTSIITNVQYYATSCKIYIKAKDLKKERKKERNDIHF